MAEKVVSNLEECIICKRPLALEKTTVVKRGLSTILAASRSRGDGLGAIFERCDPLVLHVSCRKCYTMPSALNKIIKCRNMDVNPVAPSASVPLLRSKMPDFDFKNKCVICSEDANLLKKRKKPKNRREDIRLIHTLEIKNTLIQAAKSKDDEESRKILTRLEGEFDLVAAEGRYHVNCYGKLTRCNLKTHESVGRPVNEVNEEIFVKFCQELEDDIDCQFSLSQLYKGFNDKINGDAPYTKHYFKNKLINYFGQRAVLTNFPGRDVILCLRETADRTIQEKWYTEQKLNEIEDERLRIIQQAARFIREDVRAILFDAETYQVDDKFDGMCIPRSLQTLIDIIFHQKIDSCSNIRRKKSVAEVIMQGCRPRSYTSPLLLSLGVYMHRHFASKSLLDLVSSLGFAASYHEVVTFERSLAVELKPDNDAYLNNFVQYAFDNADFNIRTLDGHSTFHNMGGIKCITPETDKLKVLLVPKISTNVNHSDLPQGRIKPLNYQKAQRNGLKSYTIRDVESDNSIVNHKHLDLLWLIGSTINESPTPSWNGYMQNALQASQSYSVSEVKILPFIDLSPSHPSCIFTALKFASEQCKKIGQNICFVTFDQPLYAKATEITASSPEFNNVIIRLGGFHLLISFLGAIGHIMGGSGIEDLWATVYAKATIVHMLTGHAYSRSVRAHVLTYQALGYLLIHNEEFFRINKESIINLHQQFLNGDIAEDDLSDHDLLKKVVHKIRAVCHSAEQISRTGKLWIQYFEQVGIILDFIRAERTGNWKLHLETVKKMIPHLHAAAHLPYAKSARLYLQQMEDLEGKLESKDFKKFTEDGYFSIRRGDKFWSGVSPDLAIEQGLMRSMKTSGGLTRGRGITDKTLSNWINVLPQCVGICENIEQFCGIYTSSSEQHVELRASRQERDKKDFNTFVGWLENHSPFISRPLEELICLSSGLVADNSVNCDTAKEIGYKSMEVITGSNFADIKLHRKDKINPISSMNKKITIRNEDIYINTQQLFSRILLVKRREEFEDLLKFELSPSPPSLFDDVSMRKTNKAVLKSILDSKLQSDTDTQEQAITTKYVIDGGFLLHKVLWPEKGATYGEICNKYVTYSTSRFPNAIVIFDGYDDPLNTKSEEHKRRTSKKTSSNLAINEKLPSTTSQEEFLGNTKNKTQFITLFTQKLQHAHIAVHHAQGDADTLIVDVARKESELGETVTVVANDTDILVLLTSSCNKADIPLYVLQEGTARTASKTYNVFDLQDAMGNMKNVLLFLHAATGCDTTSAIYNKGKKIGYKVLEENIELRIKVEVFYNSNATIEALAEAGEMFLLKLYHAKVGENLTELRYRLFKNMAKNKNNKDPFDLSHLPPTKDAAMQHFLRVYLQVQSWLGNVLNPTKWGWKKSSQNLIPIFGNLPPAPLELLNLISCNCKKGCASGRCQCRTSGLHCSVMCGHCMAAGNCSNLLEDLDNNDFL